MTGSRRPRFGLLASFLAYALSWGAFWIFVLFVAPLVLVLLLLLTGEWY